ncbi:MAG: phospholipase D-like domain-containing protein [Propionicimonas sp.]|uniref:phospholipase D-like domain-containing protein n=1 Tax=Propionicimonas sp. TaxID=1955623 RepID=UPI003D098D33
MPQSATKSTWRQRTLAVLGTAALVMSLAAAPAMAIDFTIDPTTSEAKAVPEDLGSCPTLTSEPRAVEAWFNTDDMEYRGYLDANDQSPWSYANKLAQIICGAKANSKIMIGMYFIRAIGTTARPESDAEIIWRAMDYVHSKRNVTIGMVLDGGSITPASAKSNIVKRLVDTGIAKIYWCYNGCFNTNKSSVFPYAINHEKFVTMSDTIWANDDTTTHPAVFSSSGQFARSQVRTYWQEATLIYDDVLLYRNFADRYANMKTCSGSRTSTDYINNCKGGKFVSTTNDGVTMKKQRGIWVDLMYRHYTDSGRGTTVSYSPQPVYDTSGEVINDYYSSQFDDVDCIVDSKIRVAMYRLTVTRAENFVKTMVSLKSRGCDVKVLLSQSGGATTISKKALSILKKGGASSMVKCTKIPIHTKMILITPSTSNAGRAMFGTANMTTSGLRYSEEHVITMDSRRADDSTSEDIRRAIGVYQAGWNELNQGSKACK